MLNMVFYFDGSRYYYPLKTGKNVLPAKLPFSYLIAAVR